MLYQCEPLTICPFKKTEKTFTLIKKCNGAKGQSLCLQRIYRDNIRADNVSLIQVIEEISFYKTPLSHISNNANSIKIIKEKQTVPVVFIPA